MCGGGEGRALRWGWSECFNGIWNDGIVLSETSVDGMVGEEEIEYRECAFVYSEYNQAIIDRR